MAVSTAPVPQPVTGRTFAAIFATQDGEEVTRDMQCDCGRKFTQRLLSARFLAAARHNADVLGTEAAIDRDIPEHWVPVFCPRCERRQLALEARRQAYRDGAL